MASRPERHYARRPLGYNGLTLDRGQVFGMAGCVNDQKLLACGYIAAVDPKMETFTCGGCGGEFVSAATRHEHGRDRHGPAPLDPREQDAREDRRERLLAEVAPLTI